jgi:type II secretion system protein H
VKNKGFSLIEVMVVLILISLSMFLATPILSGFSKTVELKGATKKISAILRYCRSEAVNRGKVYQVLFDPDLRQVTVQPIEEKEEDEEAKDGTKDETKDEAKDEPKQKTYTLPKGVDIKEVKANSPQYPSDYAVIEFYPNGGSNGGTIRLDSPDRKGYRIKVHFLTGIVEIEKGV